MNRRDFLRMVSNGTIGMLISHQLDLEKLLYIPGEKTIFIPPDAGWKSTSQIVDEEILRMVPRMIGIFSYNGSLWDYVNKKPVDADEIILKP